MHGSVSCLVLVFTVVGPCANQVAGQRSRHAVAFASGWPSTARGNIHTRLLIYVVYSEFRVICVARVVATNRRRLVNAEGGLAGDYVTAMKWP